MALAAGAAPLCAVGCSVLLNDPGGYYVADAANTNTGDVATANDAAHEPDTGSVGGDDGGDAAGDDAADETGVAPDGSTDSGGPDGPSCHSTQIQLPTSNQTVTSPVHVVTSWDPCMVAIDCYFDGTPTPVATAMGAPGIDASVPASPGSHFVACSTFYKTGGGGQSPSVTFVVVGDGGADQ